MKFESQYLCVEVQPSEKNDSIILRTKVKKHLSKDELIYRISAEMDTMFKSFKEKFDNIFTVNMAMNHFTDPENVIMIPEEILNCEKVIEVNMSDSIRPSSFSFTVDDIIRDDETVEKELFWMDIIHEKQHGSLSEKTLFIIEAIQMVKDHLRWIECWE